MPRRLGIGSVGVRRDRKRLLTSGTLVAHLSRRLTNCVEHTHPVHLQQARIRLSVRYGLHLFRAGPRVLPRRLLALFSFPLARRLAVKKCQANDLLCSFCY